MLGVGFAYFLAMYIVCASLLAVVRYAWPDSLPGRIAQVIS